MQDAIIPRLYRHNLSLLTDLYQLTMAYGYWKNDMHEREAVFHLFYRKAPFQGQYAIACGLQLAVEYLQDLHFGTDDIAYLAQMNGADGEALFEADFLSFLQEMTFSCNIEALPEGTIVFPNEPIIRVKGPLLQAQLIETALLNIINFSTLIATKAARVIAAADGDQVLDFGLRRAQGFDGGLSASRACFIGGCHATSNVLAGKLFDIPVRGTHAHSWVMCFEEEQQAFDAYAKAMPNNCVFLVDTYDSIQGIQNAIASAHKLRSQGHELMGIRLDSGDLAKLSQTARKMLDEAGFPNTKVVASDSLDEYEIRRLKAAGACIDIWGVGTKLVTAYDQAALGGVYKLAAIKDHKGHWNYRVKLSDSAIKVSNPGLQQLRRVVQEGQPQEDIIYDQSSETPPLPQGEDLLVPIMRKGQLVYELPDIHSIRQRTQNQVQAFPASVLSNYKVSLALNLENLKRTVIEKMKPSLLQSKNA